MLRTAVKRKTDIESLKTELLEKESEIKSLHLELETAIDRGTELEEVRRAMLYMLEDLNKSGEVIAKSQKEWLNIVDTFSDPLFVHDKEYKIVRANKAYSEVAGLSFEELIGKPYFEVFPRMDSPFKSCIDATEAKKEEEDFFQSPSGNIYRVRYFPVIKEDGSHICSTHILEDITDAKKAEEKTKEETHKCLINRISLEFYSLRTIRLIQILLKIFLKKHTISIMN